MLLSFFVRIVPQVTRFSSRSRAWFYQEENIGRTTSPLSPFVMEIAPRSSHSPSIFDPRLSLVELCGYAQAFALRFVASFLVEAGFLPKPSDFAKAD